MRHARTAVLPGADGIAGGFIRSRLESTDGLSREEEKQSNAPAHVSHPYTAFERSSVIFTAWDRRQQQ